MNKANRTINTARVIGEAAQLSFELAAFELETFSTDAEL